ncbi:MAG: hypothetical protein U5L45_00820 [Saprospiraceae bacterium]|nr:hypothetical protein [Saprospiraceae bacterium]
MFLKGERVFQRAIFERSEKEAPKYAAKQRLFSFGYLEYPFFNEIY